MIRNTHNSRHTLDENEETRLRSKDHFTAVKTDVVSTITPRRALGNIKNQMTPASGYRKNGITKSASKTSKKTLVFEDEKEDDDEFSRICARTYVPPVPWSSEEVPPFETMAPTPKEVEELLHNTTTTLVFEDDDDDDEFAKMCARTYVPPVPWTLEEVPPMESMPPIAEEVEELLQTSFILLEKDPDDGICVPILEEIY